MNTGIGIAVVVGLLAVVAFVMFSGGEGEQSAPKADTRADSDAKKPPVPEAPKPAPEPPPAAPAPTGSDDEEEDEEDDEDMVTVQASPEELAKMMAEIQGRGPDGS